MMTGGGSLWAPAGSKLGRLFRPPKFQEVNWALPPSAHHIVCGFGTAIGISLVIRMATNWGSCAAETVMTPLVIGG